MKHPLDANPVLALSHLLDIGPIRWLDGASVAGWVIWHVGWPSRIDPPIKRGRWWLWVGPYLVGKPDDTW